MNKSIKILVSIIAVVLIGFGIFWIISKPIRADQTRKQDILNFLNGKSTNNISVETKKIYKEITNLKKDEVYDISDMINDYVVKIRKSLLYKSQYPLELTCVVKTKTQDNSNESVVKSYLSSNCSCFLNRFTKDDLKLAGTEKFGKDLVKKIENIITHNTKYASNGWIIDENCLKNAKVVKEGTYEFEFPYEVYLTYTRRKTSLSNNNFIDCKITKIKENNYELVITDKKGSTYTTYMTFDHKDSWFNKRDMTINIYDLSAVYSPAKISFYTNMEITEDNIMEQEVEPETEEYSGIVFEKNKNY